MKHRKIPVNIPVCCLLITLWCSWADGSTVVIDPGLPAEVRIERLVESTSEILLECRFGEVALDTVEHGGESWLAVRIAGAGRTSDPGALELPSVSEWVKVPWRHPQIEIVETDVIERFWTGSVLPAPEVMLRSDVPDVRREARSEIYARSRFTPASPVGVDVSGSLGGASMVLVTFRPVQVNPVVGAWKLYPRIRIRLFDARRGSLDEPAEVSPSNAELVSRLTGRESTRSLDEIGDGPRMLVVCRSSYLPALQPILDWKSQSGMPTEVILYPDIASSAEGLRDHLRDRYELQSPPPEFLLLIGDVDVIPAFYGVGNSLTDHLYSTLSGEDYLPDLSVGRIPCTTPAELSTWTERLLSYERDAQLPSSLAGTVFSSSVALDPQHGQQITTLFGGAGVSVDALQQPQTGTLPLLMGSLSRNPAWVFYIGHGYAHAWSSVSPAFEIPDVQETGAGASAVIVSVACATADLDYPGASIAEEWFHQSLQSGALAYFGATESTAFFYSDTIGIAALQGIFTEGIERLGLAADYGRLACAEFFPQLPGGFTEETIQQFVLLGDPSMRVYTRTPDSLSVGCPASLPLGSTALALNVGDPSGPLDGAEVCLRSPEELYVVRRTPVSGSLSLPISAGVPQTMQLTVTARNAIPFVTEIQIVPNDAPHVQVHDLEILDTAGDGDGSADRGESCALRISIRNIGSEPSVAGTMSLLAESEEVTFAMIEAAVPGVAAGESVWLQETLPFTVSPTVQDGESAPLRFTVSAGESDPTVSLHSLLLHAPSIQFLGSELTEQTGDGDGNPEAGETLALDLRFVNGGSEMAEPLTIDLNTSPEYLQIHNTRVVTDSVRAGEEIAVRFLFDAGDDTPRGYAFEFNFELSGGNVPEQTGWSAERVGQVPVLLYELDRVPDQIAGIEVALMSLGVEYERLTALPQNLFRYHSIWIFCGVSPNTRALSRSEGTRLAGFLQGGGDCYWEGGDVWSFDMSTDLHALFHIVGVSDGTSNAGPIAGEYGTEYQHYTFEYHGENSFIDQLDTDAGSQVMLRNSRPGHEYPVCIQYAGSSYRTVGSSIEIGSLADGEGRSTRVHLVNDILRWFGIESRLDIYPPAIQHVPLTEFNLRNTPIPVTADIQDASELSVARIHYRTADGPSGSAALEMNEGFHRAYIPGMPFGTRVYYSLEAADGADPPNVAVTDEYTFVVRRSLYEPIDLSFAPRTYRLERPRIIAPVDAAWSVVEREDGVPVLEMHGTGSSEAITYTTRRVDCSHLEDVQLTFWNYLRSSGRAGRVVARVVGSVDGGISFPRVIWHRVQEGGDILEEGYVESRVINWLAGEPDVVLRFETTSDWYWRFGEIRVIGSTRAELEAVPGLIIQPHGRNMMLRWNPLPEARGYRVFASSGDRQSAFDQLSDTPDTAYIDFDSWEIEKRFYQVYGIARRARQYEGPMPPRGVSSASLSEADLRWNARLSAASGR